MALKKIPYGISNFQTMMEENYAYVDKTRFIRILEDHPAPYIFFLRPRRFGKSLFVSLMSHYYDITETDSFDTLFSGTDIGREPTPKRNTYHILIFDFSAINTASEDALIESFTSRIRISLTHFIETYDFDIQLDSI